MCNGIIDKCSLCGKQLNSVTDDNCINIYDRQFETIVNKSKIRGDNYFEKWIGKTVVTLHKDCRKRFSTLRTVPPAKKFKATEPIQPSFLLSPSNIQSLTLSNESFDQIFFNENILTSCQSSHSSSTQSLTLANESVD